jgi:5-methylcytosine-specific restriction enzyme A
MTYFVLEADEKAINVERRKARELRQTQWWKRRLAKGRCYYCGRSYAPAELTMDHLVPLVRGGKTRKGNVVTACKMCNNKKKYLLPVEWDQYLKSLSGNDDR